MFVLLCGAAYLHCWAAMLMVGVGCIAVMYDAWLGNRHFWHALVWGTASAVSFGSLALGLLATWPS